MILSNISAQEIIPPFPTGFGIEQKKKNDDNIDINATNNLTEQDCINQKNWGGVQNCVLLVYCCESFTKNNGKPLYQSACNQYSGNGSGLCESFSNPVWLNFILLCTLVTLFYFVYKKKCFFTESSKNWIIEKK